MAGAANIPASTTTPASAASGADTSIDPATASDYTMSIQPPWVLNLNQSFNLQQNLGKNMLRGRILAATITPAQRAAGTEAYNKKYSDDLPEGKKINGDVYAPRFIEYMAAAKGVDKAQITAADLSPANLLAFIGDTQKLPVSMVDNAIDGIQSVVNEGGKKQLMRFHAEGKGGSPVGKIITLIDRLYRGLIEPANKDAPKLLQPASSPSQWDAAISTDTGWVGMRRFLEDLKEKYPQPSTKYEDAITQGVAAIKSQLTPEELTQLGDGRPNTRAQSLPALLHHTVALLVDTGSSDASRAQYVQNQGGAVAAQDLVAQFTDNLIGLFDGENATKILEQMRAQHLVSDDTLAVLGIVQNALQLPNLTDTAKLIIKGADKIKAYMPIDTAPKKADPPAAAPAPTATPTPVDAPAPASMSALGDLPVGKITGSPAPAAAPTAVAA